MIQARKLLALTPGEIVLLARACVIVVIVRAAIWKLSIPRLRALAKSVAGTRRDLPVEKRPAVERIIWAIQAATWHLPDGRNCLVEAIAAEALLNRLGYPSDFRIGARRCESGGLQAHAWLESQGKVLIGAFELQTYAVMTRTAP